MRPTVPTPQEEAVCVAFRRHALLPPDDGFVCPAGDDPAPDPVLVAPAVPAARHQLPDRPHPRRHRRGSYRLKRRFKGKPRLFVAIDRTSKVAFVRLVVSAGKGEAAQFLRDLIKAVPRPAKRRFAATPCSPTTASRSPTAEPTSTTRGTSSTGSATRTASGTGSPRSTTPSAGGACCPSGRIDALRRWTNGQVERMNRARRRHGGALSLRRP